MTVPLRPTDSRDHAASGTFYAKYGKRLFDISFSLVAGIVLLPAIAIVAIVVRIVLGSPVFYCDVRAGLGGRSIRLAKFRSMSNSRDASGNLLPDHERLGRFGRMLRRTSIDELPQLLSVVVGDMSVVGPRPLPTRYVSRYDSRQVTRLLVRPGLTGWAQIHGRNAVDWSERLELDACYVDMLGRPRAWRLDFWIVAVTVFQILSQAVTGRGIAAAGSATMREFIP